MGMSRILAPAAIAAALALAGCGADSSSSGTPQGNVGGPAIDVPVQLADCTDWEDASVEERLGTIAQISNFVGGPVGTAGGHGATLTDDQAYDVMEGWCGNEYARGFRLYKLYTRAAAFGGPQ
jgi:hypothetical protein